MVLAKEKFKLRAREVHEPHATFVPFTAQTRMSGVDLHANGAQPTMRIRKGAAEAMRGFVESAGGIFPQPVAKTVDEISRRGGTPLVVADGHEDARRRSSSRTWSKAASRNASPICARWASAP